MANEASEAVEILIAALRKAEEKFPGWPDDPVHGSAIVAEESGELSQAALDYFYGRYPLRDRMLKEASHTGATALRMIISILKQEARP